MAQRVRCASAGQTLRLLQTTVAWSASAVPWSRSPILQPVLPLHVAPFQQQLGTLLDIVAPADAAATHLGWNLPSAVQVPSATDAGLPEAAGSIRSPLAVEESPAGLPFCAPTTPATSSSLHHCAACNGKVAGPSEAVQCDGCGYWHHLRPPCLGLFTARPAQGVPFYCNLSPAIPSPWMHAQAPAIKRTRWAGAVSPSSRFGGAYLQQASPEIAAHLDGPHAAGPTCASESTILAVLSVDGKDAPNLLVAPLDSAGPTGLQNNARILD
eukprot:gene10833-291_t